MVSQENGSLPDTLNLTAQRAYVCGRLRVRGRPWRRRRTRVCVRRKASDRTPRGRRGGTPASSAGVPPPFDRDDSILTPVND